MKSPVVTLPAGAAVRMSDPVKPGQELRDTLWQFRREFFMVGLLSAFVNVLMLTPTIYMMQVFDRVMVSMNGTTLMVVSVICLALFVLMGLGEWARSRVLVDVSVRLDNRLSTRVFNATFDAQMKHRALTAEGGPGRAFGDLIQLRQFVTGQGVFAFFDAPWVPIYIGVCWLLHPWLGVLALVFSIIQVLLAWVLHRRSVAPAEAAQMAQGQMQAFVQGKLRNMETIESMGMMAGLTQRWRERYERWLDLDTQNSDGTHRSSAISKFVRYVQQSASLALGAILAIQGEISAGAMIAANVLVTRALAPIDMLVGTWRPFLQARAAWKRLSKLLDAHPAREEELSQMPPEGLVQLHEVSAMAEGREQPILQRLSLGLQAGRVLVVLGPSGSGKSTLARVLLGVWPRLTGEVLLDGRPLVAWDREVLGPRIGYLPQDVELLEGSVADNIARHGEPVPERIIEAAQAAGLHDMILRLPRGYDTSVGEIGQMLSGGQRQRLALARALYGDPSLVVLDEPNANLDDVGERALAQSVQRLRARGACVVLITHRPNAIALADDLLVLEAGQVRWQGPRDQVLAQLQLARQAAPTTNS